MKNHHLYIVHFPRCSEPPYGMSCGKRRALHYDGVKLMIPSGKRLHEMEIISGNINDTLWDNMR